ncbi:hypothetical protein Fmac_020869 [Flemingia macrophylla]|uniref:Uncharacterized protein n=1 Tax=Flemingia macrophylla TaxID=520843 RepID=A0ABD1LV94_9FABA
MCVDKLANYEITNRNSFQWWSSLPKFLKEDFFKNVIGIYRAMSVRVGATQRTVKSLFKTYIDCLHIKKTDKSRMLVEDAMDVDDSGKNSQEVIFNEERVQLLSTSIDVKKGLLCQGVPWNLIHQSLLEAQTLEIDILTLIN